MACRLILKTDKPTCLLRCLGDKRQPYSQYQLLWIRPMRTPLIKGANKEGTMSAAEQHTGSNNPKGGWPRDL